MLWVRRAHVGSPPQRVTTKSCARIACRRSGFANAVRRFSRRGPKFTRGTVSRRDSGGSGGGDGKEDPRWAWDLQPKQPSAIIMLQKFKRWPIFDFFVQSGTKRGAPTRGAWELEICVSKKYWLFLECQRYRWSELVMCAVVIVVATRDCHIIIIITHLHRRGESLSPAAALARNLTWPPTVTWLKTQTNV